MLVERKVAFNQNAGNLGRWWTQRPPKTTSKESAQPWKFLKGKREVISVNQSYRHPPVYAGLSCRLVDAILLSLFTQFVRLLKRKLRKRSGVLLVTYSSFLLLRSTERTDMLGKVLCDQKIWKLRLGQRWVEHGGAWFKVSDKTKGASCRELFPARSCLQTPHLSEHHSISVGLWAKVHLL